jgi:hypothetical protein
MTNFCLFQAMVQDDSSFKPNLLLKNHLQSLKLHLATKSKTPNLKIYWNNNKENWEMFASSVKYARQHKQEKLSSSGGKTLPLFTTKKCFWVTPTEPGKGFYNDIYLAYHGTSGESALNIIKNGFQPSCFPVNGNLQGTGCYVSPNLSTAADYSSKSKMYIHDQDYEAHYFCLIAFLPGKMCKYKPTIKAKDKIDTTYLDDKVCLRTAVSLPIAILEIRELAPILAIVSS